MYIYSISSVTTLTAASNTTYRPKRTEANTKKDVILSNSTIKKTNPMICLNQTKYMLTLIVQNPELSVNSKESYLMSEYK